MGQCPFCEIAAGGADEDLVALRTPAVIVVPVTQQRSRNRGHVLVLPTSIPRRAGDGFRMPDPAKDELSREERRQQAASLRRALAE